MSEAGLEKVDDDRILEFARQRERTCVTLDHDFHASGSVVRGEAFRHIRSNRGTNAKRQAELIRAVWDTCAEAIAAGAAISTDGVTVRLHRLPLK